MKLLGPKTCNFLDEQGFTFLSVEEKSSLNIALRITPTLCIIVAVVGLYLESWEIFAVLSAFGFLGFTTKSWQPFDVLYNYVISPIIKWPKLPESPAPKRFACFLGFIFLVGCAVSVYFGDIGWAYFFGIAYTVAAGIMAVSHLCVGSWFWHHILGK